jgi:hypothetical protein
LGESKPIQVPNTGGLAGLSGLQLTSQFTDLFSNA